VVAGAANRRFDVLALGSFVVLGLPDGILGTAWPSMRVTFGVPVGGLGLILLLGTTGSVPACPTRPACSCSPASTRSAHGTSSLTTAPSHGPAP
jgi:hypothetical protein